MVRCSAVQVQMASQAFADSTWAARAGGRTRARTTLRPLFRPRRPHRAMAFGSVTPAAARLHAFCASVRWLVLAVFELGPQRGAPCRVASCRVVHEELFIKHAGAAAEE